MITDNELLTSIRETAMMGRTGIDGVLKYSACEPLTGALRQQRAEYGELLREATDLLTERGEIPEPLPLGSRMGAAMSRAKYVLSPPTASDIAGMMITGNTKGVIKSMQRRRDYLGRDDRVAALGKKLLETETRNIEQMKPFL